MKKTLLLTTILILTLSVCKVENNYYYNYNYIITNKANAKITIKLSTPIFDSTYILEYDERILIFSTDHGNEEKNGPYFKSVSSDLLKISVYKNDTILSRIDYKKDSAWEFHIGDYSSIINNEEFD